jgi:hypothetical protein
MLLAMGTRVWVVIFLLIELLHPRIVASGQAKGKVPTKTATVSVLVTDTFGMPLPTARIEMRRLEGRKELPIEIAGSTARDVPYGIYRISAELSGFRIDSRTVEVDQPVKWFMLALALGEIEGPSTRDLRGRIESPTGTFEQVWVKLVGIYSHTIREAPVNEKGHFVIDDVQRGAYLIIILEPGRVLKVQQFGHFFSPADIRGEEMVIKLSQ